MYSKQMLCIVTPPFAVDFAAIESDSARQRLDGLFRRLGRVHFASLALLPPRPGAAVGTTPSLLLEMAIDDGLEPSDLIDLLVQHGFAALWPMFEAIASQGEGAPESLQREWLRAFLLRHLHRAGGGFIGVRDRSVAQILAETELFKAAAHEFRSHVVKTPAGSDAMALAMANWIAADRHLRWATVPAGRSFWRSRWGNFGRALIIGTLAVAFIASLWMLFKFTFGAWYPAAPAFIQGLLADIVRAGLASAATAIAVALLAAFAVMSVPRYLGARVVVAVFAGCAGAALWVGAWLLELVQPGLRWTLNLLQSVCPRPWTAAIARFFDPWLREWNALQLLETIVLSILIVIATASVLFLALRLLGGLTRWLNRPLSYDLEGAQQVQAAIELAEANLVGRLNHMISLTEVRRPIWLFSRVQRFWLGVVGVIGHVFNTEGRLGDAPGILFGHWHVIDGGRRLLFCSNYAGTFGGYLDDFINGAGGGVNLVWRWTCLRIRPAARAGDPVVLLPREYPPTRLGAFGGCHNEQWFKTYARDSMLPHIYRFEAYPYAFGEIARAARLRDALCGARTPIKDEQAMRALES